jgi:hypothetical protein
MLNLSTLAGDGLLLYGALALALGLVGGLLVAYTLALTSGDLEQAEAIGRLLPGRRRP